MSVFCYCVAAVYRYSPDGSICTHAHVWVLTGLPVQHSEYVESAMELLVQPIVAATDHLQTDAQLTALTTALSALCEAWSTNILSHKIRFR